MEMRMSEIINLIPNNPDVHVYAKAVELLSERLDEDYSFVINVWSQEMPDTTKHKRILISTSDEVHKTPKEAEDERYFHIFKQYHPMVDMSNPSSLIKSNKVTALPLCELEGIEDQNIPILERKYDWSWMGQFDPYKRADFKKSIDQLSQNDQLSSKVLWYSGWNNGDSTENYCDVVNQTKIMPIPRGSASLESFRFFEAMKCGCVPVCVNQPEVDFYKIAPYFSISSWDQIQDFMQNIVKQEEEIRFLSEQAKLWHKYFCSPEGLCDYMYRTLRKNHV